MNAGVIVLTVVRDIIIDYNYSCVSDYNITLTTATTGSLKYGYKISKNLKVVLLH